MRRLSLRTWGEQPAKPIASGFAPVSPILQGRYIFMEPLAKVSGGSAGGWERLDVVTAHASDRNAAMKPEGKGEPEQPGVVYPDPIPSIADPPAAAEGPANPGFTEDPAAQIGRWEYRVSTADDLVGNVDRMMKSWGDAGWELVSGSTSSWASSSPMSAGTLWHTRYTCFWRRRID
jgi:hypothetical protein